LSYRKFQSQVGAPDRTKRPQRFVLIPLGFWRW